MKGTLKKKMVPPPNIPPMGAGMSPGTGPLGSGSMDSSINVPLPGGSAIGSLLQGLYTGFMQGKKHNEDVQKTQATTEHVKAQTALAKAQVKTAETLAQLYDKFANPQTTGQQQQPA